MIRYILIRVLFCSYYTTITGWEVLLKTTDGAQGTCGMRNLVSVVWPSRVVYVGIPVMDPKPFRVWGVGPLNKGHVESSSHESVHGYLGCCLGSVLGRVRQQSACRQVPNTQACSANSKPRIPNSKPNKLYIPTRPHYPKT